MANVMPKIHVDETFVFLLSKKKGSLFSCFSVEWEQLILASLLLECKRPFFVFLQPLTDEYWQSLYGGMIRLLDYGTGLTEAQFHSCKPGTTSWNTDKQVLPFFSLFGLPDVYDTGRLVYQDSGKKTKELNELLLICSNRWSAYRYSRRSIKP